MGFLLQALTVFEGSHMATVKSGTIYDAKDAPVTKHGGNTPIHDGIRTDTGTYAPQRNAKDGRTTS